MQPGLWSARVAAVGALVAAALVAPLSSAPVSAADPAAQLASVRKQIDQLGNEYFTARQRLAALDGELASLRGARGRLERSYATEHRLAVRRAVARYTEGNDFETDSASVLQAANASVILEHAAETTNAAMNRFIQTRSSLLDTQRRITTQRRAQQTLVNQLAQRTQTLNAELASAQRAYREMLAAQAARAAAAANAKVAAGSTPKQSNTVAATTPTVPPVSTPAPVPTPAPPPPPGTNPHHDDPFLSCVRQRESSGYYGAVNPGGYYGAYQFAITTWNITASHAGRPSLIGVRPDHASPWDQDDMAWTLYQWQGEAPWGGHCP
jgi:hypothetical protein